MPDIIERAARALYGEPGLSFIRDCTEPSASPKVRKCPPHGVTWDDAQPETKEAFRDHARAVLRAIREPSEGMIEEGYASYDANGGSLRDAFMDMIDAALGEG